MFWVGYEQSAYYIWQIKGYKPTKKFVKSVAVEVVQIGFPGIEEFLLTDNLEIIEKQDTFISCTSIHAINKQCFEEWKANINTVQLFAITGSFTASGSSATITVTKPTGMTGYYTMVTYKDGKTFRKEIFSFDTVASINNVITGTGPYSEVYPAGTYNYVLEYFK